MSVLILTNLDANLNSYRWLLSFVLADVFLEIFGQKRSSIVRRGTESLEPHNSFHSLAHYFGQAIQPV